MQQLLSLFNLSQNEKTIYETLFYGGLMSASQISKKANLSRTSSYDLLKNLISSGLISETTKLGVKMYTIQPPEKINLLLEEKQKSITNAGQELDYLQQIYNSQRKSMKPRLQLFEEDLAG